MGKKVHVTVDVDNVRFYLLQLALEFSDECAAEIKWGFQVITGQSMEVRMST